MTSGFESADLETYRRELTGYCYRMLGSAFEAEDAVQEAFLHAYRALHRFLPDQAFGAWLHRIVANAALDITRRRKVRDADELPETVAPALRHHSYAECAREPYGRAVVRAYLTAHAPAAWQRNDWHALAWLHHSGRRGMAQGRGRTYADRVVALMGGGR